MSISAPANPDSQDSANNFSIKKAMIPIILLTFACLFSTYPGIYMQDDVISVWEEVTENHLFDWHPIGYELFCKVCFYIYKSPFTVNVVQSLAWLLLNYEILKFLSEIQPNGKAARIYTAASIFVFTPFLYLQVMMKDIVYSICLVAFTLQLFILLTKKTGRKTYILLVLSGLGTALFRHAQMIPVMVTLLILLLFHTVHPFHILSEKEKRSSPWDPGIYMCHTGSLHSHCPGPFFPHIKRNAEPGLRYLYRSICHDRSCCS